MMENIDFNSPKFSIKSLEEVKKSYKSGDMKEHLEFIKKSIKKILLERRKINWQRIFYMN